MRLDRIKRIRGYGIFKDFSWPTSLPPFGRVNLIYGWNGSGKTTLSKVLRSLHERHVVEGEVVYEVDGNVISSISLTTATLPWLNYFG